MMKYCDSCGATYSDRIAFCFTDGTALFARRSALDLPSLDGPLGTAPLATATTTDSDNMSRLTTEEFLQIPTRRSGMTAVNPLFEPPPPAWEEPSLTPAPTDPIGAVSFDDTHGFFDAPDSPVKPTKKPKAPKAPKVPRKPKTSRQKPPIKVIVAGGLVALCTLLFIFWPASTDDAPIPTPPVVAEPIAKISASSPHNSLIDAIPETDHEALAVAVPVDKPEEPAAPTPVIVTPTMPTVPTAVKTAKRATVRRPKPVVAPTPKPAPEPVVAPESTIDNPWGLTEQEIVATTGRVSFTSTPSGATIWVGRDKKGITPLTLDLAFDTYSVKAELVGHTTQQLVIPITTATPVPIGFALSAVARVGKIQISSQNHTGKILTMDGSPKGTLPLQIRNVSEGRHTFVIDGQATTIDVVFNDNLTLALTL